MFLLGRRNGFTSPSSCRQTVATRGTVPPAGSQRSVHVFGSSLPRPSGQYEIVSCVSGVCTEAP